MVTELKGQNGKIIVFEDCIAISRSTFGGFVSQGGFSGERKIFFKDISAIEYKKPTFFANGYIKVILPGTNEINAKVGLMGSLSDSMKDQNTIVLRAFTAKVGNEIDRIYSIIMQKFTEAKNNQTNTNTTIQPSKMDELKKIGELKIAGFLTEEEFQKEKEKEKLLNKD